MLDTIQPETMLEKLGTKLCFILSTINVFQSLVFKEQSFELLFRDRVLLNGELQCEDVDLGLVPVLPRPRLDIHLHSPGPCPQQSLLPFLLPDTVPVQHAVQLDDVLDDNYPRLGEHQHEREGGRHWQV